MDIGKVMESLKKKGYEISHFATYQEATAYLNRTIQGKTVGFGGSQTLTDMDLRHSLREHNTVYVPDFAEPSEGGFYGTAHKASNAEIFLLSANAMSENGDIINIDGTSNRLAGSMWGPKKVYFIVGANKIGGTLEEAMKRARNVAGPKNALRLHCKTPCAMAVMKKHMADFMEKQGDKGFNQLAWQEYIEGLSDEELGTHCYDCKSPQRICGSMLIHYMKPDGVEAEAVLVDEDCGF